MINIVDLFCGAGGLTCGLQQAGLKVVAGIDFDASCAYAYEKNNNSKFLHKKIQDVTGDELNALYADSEVHVLVGCAPCQPFSTHTQKLRKEENGNKDERWFLITDFLRLVKEIKPDIVSMENVPNLATQDIFHEFVAGLKAEGYSVSYSVVFCPDYGIPQNRHRLVLMASLWGSCKLMPPTHESDQYRTVRDTIGLLPRIAQGESAKEDRLHRSSRLNAKNLQRIRSSRPGGTWRDWDENLVCECHKRASGKSYGSVYARMEWDKPSPTITTEFYNYGTGRFGHPEQDRAISLREGALLQTFPPDYDFLPEGVCSFKQAGKMIGNAVPVLLGKAIGETINEHVRSWRK